MWGRIGSVPTWTDMESYGEIIVRSDNIRIGINRIARSSKCRGCEISGARWCKRKYYIRVAGIRNGEGGCNRPPGNNIRIDNLHFKIIVNTCEVVPESIR